MEVILTHEQADFDALAAMLGFHLHHPSATPVLPLSLNLNVQDFLKQYRGALPFVRRQNLDKEPVQCAYLVDTQSLNTIKGMSRATEIRVLDHHDLRHNRPANWEIEIEQIGACTTLLVEKLQTADAELTTIQATLLLLGIYEDTGSMTYVHTTARDVKAVVWLLEQGASLRIANRFLNSPLSAQQITLYDKLLKNTRSLQLYGQQIIISCADASTMTDEISSVAHKLRDLLAPDAIFLIVKTAAGMRIVARSTSDQINVAEVAAHFGGGGHERAAAALIRRDEQQDEENALETLCNDIQNVIGQFISPPITVSELMSTGPTVLSPATSAGEAAQIMQRYGYEGYPVVRRGKVIGLLTRRAVDRALAHKLELTAGSLMEAGEVSVSPQDSLQHLQRVMQKTGWGQIPVVKPSGKIIGIVTRTDVLKIITGEGAPRSEQQNLAADLEKALPAAHLALIKTIAGYAHKQEAPAYIVGGFVRDLILKRPSLDFDIVIEGNAIEVCKAIANNFGGKMTSHSRFGTAKWRIESIREALAEQLSSDSVSIQGADLPASLDFISSRTEFYDYPTALPTVERSSIKLDLHRRDFTFNTLALRLDGSHYGDLYDHWGGLHDLQRGLVRVLHSLSFVDDPTRMLRAVRFEQRFGFQIEPRTLKLIDEAQKQLSKITGQRLEHEFGLILSEAEPQKMLARLEDLKLLSAIHPDLGWSDKQAAPLQKVLQATPTEEWSLPGEINGSSRRVCLGYLCWFNHYKTQTLKSIAKRLRFSKSLQKVLLDTARLARELPSLEGKPVSQITYRLDSTQDITLYFLTITCEDDNLREMILQYKRVWQHMRPVTNGDTLRAMDIPPGPLYARILTALRSAWLDGDIHSNDEETALLNQLLAKEK
jgi:tRNA nucleotidyltransferase (CCA-adding enzyme)